MPTPLLGGELHVVADPVGERRYRPRGGVHHHRVCDPPLFGFFRENVPAYPLGHLLCAVVHTGVVADALVKLLHSGDGGGGGHSFFSFLFGGLFLFSLSVENNVRYST